MINVPGPCGVMLAALRFLGGKAHITYTWNRKKIKHVELDPKVLTLHYMPEGGRPK